MLWGDEHGPGGIEHALAFVMRNLHKVQAGRGVNAPGMPEIPEEVFEELLVNALIHRLCKALHKACYAKEIVMQSRLTQAA